MDRQVHHDRVRPGVGEAAGGGPVRCEAPLSMIQNTRWAEIYGSVPMTWFTRAVNGLMPVVGSHRPMMLDGRKTLSDVCPVRWPVMDLLGPVNPPESGRSAARDSVLCLPLTKSGPAAEPSGLAVRAAIETRH